MFKNFSCLSLVNTLVVYDVIPLGLSIKGWEKKTLTKFCFQNFFVSESLEIKVCTFF